MSEEREKEVMQEPHDIEAFLDEQKRLELLLKSKFTHVLTVMFTDLKGSTALAEAEGDLVSRMLIKHQNEILLPALEENHGVFIKSIGDGTLSRFDNAQDAVRAAVRIQRGMDQLNMSGTFRMPVLMRVGLHTGKCLLEKDDIFGDTVNTASRFESSAGPGEIYLSEDTYNALTDKSEIYCRFIKQVALKGKKEPYNAYKAFWNPEEVEIDRQQGDQQMLQTPSPTSRLKLILIIAIPLLIVLALALRQPIMHMLGFTDPVRTIEHSVP
jgi:class 3 adenylate cyclase